MQVRAEIGCPWPEHPHHGFPPVLQFKTRTSTGKIIAVWLSNSDLPAPVIQVVDATSGVLEQTISLPVGIYEGYGADGPWWTVDFELTDFAMSPNQEVLAIATPTHHTWDSSLLWLVDLQSGTVSYQNIGGDSEIYNHDDIGTLSFSPDGKVLAVVSGGGDSFGPKFGLWLLSATSGQPVMHMRLAGRRAFFAPHDAVLIVPRCRIVLFLDSWHEEDGQAYVLHHVPAGVTDTQHLEHHAYAPPPRDSYDIDVYPPSRSCMACGNMTLEGGSFSPCGSLFVTLVSAQPEARLVGLEHWQLDHGKKLSTPHLVHEIALGSDCGAWQGDFETLLETNEDIKPLHLLVAWHPFCARKLVYAVAIGEGMRMVHIVDGCTHAVLQAIDVGAQGLTDPVSQLEWSPDGFRLAVRTRGHVHVLAFGSARPMMPKK